MRTPFVLIVEDESLIAGLIADVLALEGCRTKRAMTGACAVALVHEEQPDLVILDLRLETPDAGWCFLQALRHDPRLATTPVLICSADVFSIDEHIITVQAPHTDVLVKPFSIDALLEKVRGALQSSLRCRAAEC